MAVMAPAVEKRKKPKVWTREIVNRALIDSLRKLDPRTLYKNPIILIVEIGALLTIDPLRPRPRQRQAVRDRPLRAPDLGLALVHGALRELRRGDRRRPRQGPGRHPPQDPQHDHRPARQARRLDRDRHLRGELRRGDIVLVETERDHPRRRRRRSKAWPTSTRPPSPASPRPSSRSPALTSAARSPAARLSSATTSTSASPPTPARRSSTA